MNETLTDMTTNRTVRMAVVAVLAILALFLLVKTVDSLGEVGRSDMPAMNTITVNGTGTATLAPDVARITFSVMHDASTVAAAQDEATKQTNNAIDFIEEEGIDEKDVKTTSYNINPQYSYPVCGPGTMCVQNGTITGYQVSQTVQVTVRDLDKVSTLLAGLGDLNVQNLYGPEFALDDSTAAQNAARADAINQAQAQAEVLADQLGVRLVRIVSYNDSSGYPMYYKGYGGVAMDARMESAVANPAPEIPMGENEYTANVSITYEIR